MLAFDFFHVFCEANHSTLGECKMKQMPRRY